MPDPSGSITKVSHFFGELRRRNVPRACALYAAAAWLLAQIVTQVGPVFELPAWGQRWVIVALIVGFPFAAVLSWFYEFTPHGLQRESTVGHGDRAAGDSRRRLDRWIVAVLALAVVVLLADKFVLHKDSTAADGRSVAVLPFVNMSGESANEYFSDGMTETLLNRLAQVPQLKVAARTSSFVFKGKNVDVRRIGAELGVGAIVEGSVQRAGDTLRITAQLISVADGNHLWSHNYDRKAADLFAIQDEIAGEVTQSLIGELLPQTKQILATGGTRNLAAYDAYTRGLHEFATDTGASLARAEASYQQALTLDPDYVDAMLGLAETWLFMNRAGMLPRAGYVARATPILDRAQAIDPGSGRLLALRADLAAQRGERDLATTLVRKALALAPGDARVHHIAGFVFKFFGLGQWDGFGWGDAQAGLDEMDKAVALSPLDANMHFIHSLALMSAGHLDEARRAGLRAVQLDPNNPEPPFFLQLIAWQRGDTIDAIAWDIKADRLDPTDDDLPSMAALYFGSLGDTTTAAAWLAEARRRTTTGWRIDVAEARLHNAHGEYALALEKAMAVLPQRDYDHLGWWNRGIAAGCIAARLTGRQDEFNGALVKAGFLPREVTPEAFAEWRGAPGWGFPKDKLRDLLYLRHCVVAQDDAPRREQLRALAASVEGANWENEPDLMAAAADLRNDRDAIVAYLTQAGSAGEKPLTALAYPPALARLLGVADDPRIVRHLAEQGARAEQMRAQLPAILAREGLSMEPQVPKSD